jgi:hypothetical protein
MINVMKEQNTTQSFFAKYKKWFVALIGIQLLPTILMIGGLVSMVVYSVATNDVHYHPYKSYIISGAEVGYPEGKKDKHSGGKTSPSSWSHYKYDTRKLKKEVFKEKEEYLVQFLESERGLKLAEMKINNIKLPLQLELDKRFTSGLDFYADYVKQRVSRDDWASDEDYQKALQNEAWKVGYDHGYKEGRNRHLSSTAHDSLR